MLLLPESGMQGAGRWQGGGGGDLAAWWGEASGTVRNFPPSPNFIPHAPQSERDSNNSILHQQKHMENAYLFIYLLVLINY